MHGAMAAHGSTRWLATANVCDDVRNAGRELRIA
jgi:hypothetical protein